MAFNRETTVYAGQFQDAVNTGIIKLDTDLTNAFTYLNQLLSSLAGKVNATEKGTASGVCPLDSSAKIATAYLPTIPVSLIPSTVGFPVGGIMPWPTDTAPTNYLPCEGGYYSTSTYATLYAVLGTRYGAGSGTFRVPDYRGMFLRGWDHAAGVDPDAGDRLNRGDGTTGDNVGTIQNDAVAAHVHSTLYLGQNAMASGGTYTVTDLRNWGAGTGAPYYSVSGNSGDTPGNETRPINQNVLWVIKYQ